MAKSNSPASWHPDPKDPELVRFWDGEKWTEQRRPLSLHLAEQQLAASERIADAAEAIRGILVFFIVLGVIGGVLSVIAVAQASK